MDNTKRLFAYDILRSLVDSTVDDVYSQMIPEIETEFSGQPIPSFRQLVAALEPREDSFPIFYRGRRVQTRPLPTTEEVMTQKVEPVRVPELSVSPPETTEVLPVKESFLPKESPVTEELEVKKALTEYVNAPEADAPPEPTRERGSARAPPKPKKTKKMTKVVPDEAPSEEPVEEPISEQVEKELKELDEIRESPPSPRKSPPSPRKSPPSPRKSPPTPEESSDEDSDDEETTPASPRKEEPALAALKGVFQANKISLEKLIFNTTKYPRSVAISGDTKRCGDQLKALGFQWNRTNKCWLISKEKILKMNLLTSS